MPGNDKFMRELMRGLTDEDRESPAKMQAVIDRIMTAMEDEGEQQQDLTSQEQAMEMVFDAYDLPPQKGAKLAKEALKIDPACVDAYVFLGQASGGGAKSFRYYQKALKAAEKLITKDFIEANKGHFWGLHETRPYMRAKEGMADCLMCQGKFDEAIDCFEDMLELNPGDNQGVRYTYAICLLLEDRDKDFLALWMRYKDDSSSSWPYNYALSMFKTKGATKAAEKALLKAIDANGYVVKYMLGALEWPGGVPDRVGIGDESEAQHYLCNASPLWTKTEGAYLWVLAVCKGVVSED